MESARLRGDHGSRRPADELTARIRRDTRDWRVVRPALVIFILVIGAGALLGTLAFAIAGDHHSWPTTVLKTSNGWRLSSPDGLEQSSLALNDHYLAWSNGGCLELLDLRSGHTTVLQPPSVDGTGGVSGLISDRYVAWLVYRAAGSDVHAYDLAKRRSFTVADVGDRCGTIALSHTVLCWATDETTALDPNRMAIHVRELAGGRSVTVVAGDVVLRDIAGDLVMWTQAFGTRAGDSQTVVKDLVTGRVWRLKLADPEDLLDCRLAGHCVVWAKEVRLAGSTAPSTCVYALDLRNGTRRLVAEGRFLQPAVSDGWILWTNTTRPGRAQVFKQAADGGAVVSPEIPSDDFSTMPVASGTTLAWTHDKTEDRPSEVVIARMKE